MLTLPPFKFPSVNIMLAFRDRSALCNESLTRYSWESVSQVSPKDFSNKVHDSTGSQIYGSEESRNAGIAVGRREELVELSDTVMELIWTVRSRISTEEKDQETPLFTNLDLS